MTTPPPTHPPVTHPFVVHAEENAVTLAPDPAHLARTVSDAVGTGRVDQVAFLVEDLESAMDRWQAFEPGEEWRIYTYGPDNVHDLTYRGQPAQFSMRLALISTTPQIELIQPLKGPSIYAEWIDRHGFGLHHFGFFVASIDDAVRAFENAGHPTIQAGRGYGLDGDGGFAYFDLEDTFAIHLEAIEVPRRRRPSEPRQTSTP